jgi:xanthine dehydrogenase accessory factor
VSRAILAELLATIDAGRPVALVSVVDTRRSVPRHAGSKMLVHAEGRTHGSIGGGEMERRAIAAANDALHDGRNRLLTYQLVDPSAGDPGVCGGEVVLSVEAHMPSPVVYVVGCGHVGRAVVDLAHWLGFRVVATDDRPEVATREQLPLADTVICGTIADALAAEPVTAETHVVVVTRNMKVDLDVLPHLLATPARSIGVMGSTRRWNETRNALLAAGVDGDALARVHAPIGLELHAETPEEIAVSVLAEIVALRRTPRPADESNGRAG